MTIKSKNIKSISNLTIPTNWQLIELGDLFEFRNGLNKEKQAFGDGTPIVNYVDVYKSNYIETTELKGRVTLSQSEINRFEVRKGDVFFTRTSETIEDIGLAAVVIDEPKDTVFSGFLLRARPKNNKLDLLFKKYCFSTFQVRKEIIRKSTYTTRALTNGTYLSQVVLLLPPIEEQRIIAHVLSSWDEAIDKIQALIVQKELCRKWLMQNLLTGKKRLRGFNGEWKEYHLGDMFIERNDTKNNGLVLLSIGQNGVYLQSESNKKDISNADKSKYKRICPGDIGYNTMRMWQGRSALSHLEGIVSPAYTIVTPKGNADSLFFSYLFKTPKLINLFWRNSQGLVNDTLNCKFKDFSIVKVHLPEKEEQTTIAQVLHAADKEIHLLKTKTEKLKEQKKWMMQMLLTGKKRLRIPK